MHVRLLLGADCILSTFQEHKNPANILTKPLPWFSLKIFVEPLLPWKGNTVDAPLGTANPEGSDAGLGSTVPDELQSHKQDLMHVNGHDSICVPAALCGNQCAVLFDTMPTDNEFLHGMLTVMAFDFTWIGMGFVFACLPT